MKKVKIMHNMAGTKTLIVHRSSDAECKDPNIQDRPSWSIYDMYVPDGSLSYKRCFEMQDFSLRFTGDWEIDPLSGGFNHYTESTTVYELK